MLITDRERYRKSVRFATGGIVPHSIEMTSLFTSSILLDEQMVADDTTVRLSYSMAMIKFVNGLLDPYQQSSYAMSLFKLAEITGLPGFFVELRHIGTHESIPSLQALRWATKCALTWLDNNYWQTVINIEEEEPQKRTEIKSDRMDTIHLIRNNLDILKQIRRDDPNGHYKRSERSKEGKDYWKSIDSLLKICTTDEGHTLVVNILIFNGDYLILRSKALSDRNLNGLTHLYTVILQDLGYDLVFDLLDRLCDFLMSDTLVEVSSRVNYDEVLAKSDLRFMLPRNKGEKSQAEHWVRFFLSNTVKFGRKTQVKRLINDESASIIVGKLGETNSPKNIELLQEFQRENHKLLIRTKLDELVNKTLATMRKFSLPTFDFLPQAKRKLEKSTEIVYGPSLKRQKRESHPTVHLFDKYDDWVPLPFGCTKH